MGPVTAALQSCLQLFQQRGDEYALMGGFAVRAHGVPRPTYDVDFTLALDRDELPRLYEDLEQAGYTVAEPYWKGWVDEVGGMPIVKFRLYVKNQSIDADVFLAESEYQRELLRRRTFLSDFEDVPNVSQIPVVTAEDLVLLKLMANRPRDYSDVIDVRFMSGQLDEAYMRRWAAELGIADRLEAVLAEPMM